MKTGCRNYLIETFYGVIKRRLVRPNKEASEKRSDERKQKTRRRTEDRNDGWTVAKERACGQRVLR